MSRSGPRRRIWSRAIPMRSATSSSAIARAGTTVRVSVNTDGSQASGVSDAPSVERRRFADRVPIDRGPRPGRTATASPISTCGREPGGSHDACERVERGRRGQRPRARCRSSAATARSWPSRPSATNLVRGDTNGVDDVFVLGTRDGSGPPREPGERRQGDGPSGNVSVSSDGLTIAYATLSRPAPGVAADPSSRWPTTRAVPGVAGDHRAGAAADDLAASRRATDRRAATTVVQITGVGPRRHVGRSLRRHRRDQFHHPESDGDTGDGTGAAAGTVDVQLIGQVARRCSATPSRTTRRRDCVFTTDPGSTTMATPRDHASTSP